MSSSSSTSGPPGAHNDKTVTGYPAHHGQVVAGYPYAAMPSTFHGTLGGSAPLNHHVVDGGGGADGYPCRGLTGRTILFRLIVSAATVFSVMSLMFFISKPVIRSHLPEFRVVSASVTPLNTTRSELSAAWAFAIQAANPNSKLSIHYDRVEASVMYGGDFRLTMTRLAPFYQGKDNVTTVRAQFSVLGDYIGEGMISSILDEKARGSVTFGLNVMASFHCSTSAWRTRQHLLQVFCDEVRMQFSSNISSGIYMGSPPTRACKVIL